MIDADSGGPVTCGKDILSEWTRTGMDSRDPHVCFQEAQGLGLPGWTGADCGSPRLLLKDRRGVWPVSAGAHTFLSGGQPQVPGSSPSPLGIALPSPYRGAALGDWDEPGRGWMWNGNDPAGAPVPARQTTGHRHSQILDVSLL